MADTHRPGHLDPRALIARLNQQSRELLQREIIAPLLPGGRIRTRLAGLIYEFTVQTQFSGWGRFAPQDERTAGMLGEALPWERGAYLELLPALRVVLLWPQQDARAPGTWLALPYNEGDAYQRFRFPLELLPVFLCDPTAGAERFARVIARVDGRTLWFEGPDVLANPEHAEWLREAACQETGQKLLSGLAGSERLALLFWRLRQLELSLPAGAEPAEHLPRAVRRQMRAWLEQQTQRLHLEQRLQHALAKADATLHTVSEISTPDGMHIQLLIEWSADGQTRRYRSVIDPALTVVSSGICLSGRDHEFDLTSLVSVLADAGH